MIVFLPLIFFSKIVKKDFIFSYTILNVQFIGLNFTEIYNKIFCQLPELAIGISPKYQFQCTSILLPTSKLKNKTKNKKSLSKKILKSLLKIYPPINKSRIISDISFVSYIFLFYPLKSKSLIIFDISLVFFIYHKLGCK